MTTHPYGTEKRKPQEETLTRDSFLHKTLLRPIGLLSRKGDRIQFFSWLMDLPGRASLRPVGKEGSLQEPFLLALTGTR